MIKSYIDSFFHPIRSYDFLRCPVSELETGVPHRLKIHESILLSWICDMMRGLYEVFFIYILMNIILFFIESINIPLLNDSNVKGHFYFILLASVVINVIFYPVWEYGIVLTWKFFINLGLNFAYLPSGIEKKVAVDDVLALSLSSNILKFIPIVGKSLSTLYFIVLVYLGLRRRMLFSPVGASLIALGPILFFFMMLAGMLVLCFMFKLILF